MDTGSAVEPRGWLATVRSELTHLLDQLDPRAFDTLCTEFADERRRWFFTGQGRSGRAAAMAAMRLMHLGRRTHLVGEASAPAVRAGDGLLVISGSGRTQVSVGFARIARAEGATVVALTAHPDSALGELADVVFPIPATGSRQLGGSLFEQVSLIVLDALAMQLADALPDARERFTRLHTNLQ
jgi:6-phospho-3-hexuloisomerase